ncbi:hypothetical protein D9M68_939680 [compost metagenome]
MRLGRGVHILPCGARLDPHQHGLRIHRDGATLAHVDGDAAIAEGGARHIVPTPAHGKRQAIVPGEGICCRYIGFTGGSHHDGGALVDHAVPDGATCVKGGIARQVAGAGEAFGQVGNGRWG